MEYNSLSKTHNKFICAEYVWIDALGELRSKAKTLILENSKSTLVVPPWNYDGSSTGQSIGNNSEINIIPRYIVKCPFRRGNNILAMCDTYNPDGTPAIQNNRYWAKNLFNKNLDAKPWYGIEQEYFMFNKKTSMPLGFDEENSQPKPQGQYYCGVGTNNAFGRQIAEIHYEHCLYAELNISGINGEVAPGQWEYQIGPVEGIEAGDQLFLSRYILHRIAEKYDVFINLHPKPIAGDWNGSGCHTNYSTKQMRDGTLSDDGKSGLEYINNAINKLSLKHNVHIDNYGTGNELRMTGNHETSNYYNFNYGVANRKASIRIPTETANNKCGYFEDRRPSSNMDPYLVTGMIFNTTVLE